MTVPIYRGDRVPGDKATAVILNSCWASLFVALRSIVDANIEDEGINVDRIYGEGSTSGIRSKVATLKNSQEVPFLRPIITKGVLSFGVMQLQSIVSSQAVTRTPGGFDAEMKGSTGHVFVTNNVDPDSTDLAERITHDGMRMQRAGRQIYLFSGENTMVDAGGGSNIIITQIKHATTDITTSLPFSLAAGSSPNDTFDLSARHVSGFIPVNDGQSGESRLYEMGE